MKTYTLEEVTDKFIGKQGSAERDKFDKKYEKCKQKELKKGK